MKKYKVSLYVFAALMGLLNACNSEEIDDKSPIIDTSFQDAFPVNCDTLYLGETFEFNMLFADNVELGSYSIDIHQNFNHHAHSTEVDQCDFQAEKDPVNPFKYVNDFEIPEGSSEFETFEGITIPEGDEEGLFDEGDYHFFISLTDKSGWSVQKGLSIKILRR